MIYVHSWDTAFSTCDGADYTAVTKWAYNSTGYYLLDAQRFKATSEEVENAFYAQPVLISPIE